jgi:DNA primase
MNVLSSAALFYNQNLFSSSGKKYLKYLTETRGLQEDILKKHLIGCSNNYFDLYNHLRKEKFSHDAIYKAGLIQSNKKDVFYNYVVFPTIEENKVTYLTGRHILDSHEYKHKHIIGGIPNLFNADLVSGSSFIILTEAIIDCLTLLQNGFPAVSCLGVNSFKIRHIKPFMENHKVYLMFDNDPIYDKGFRASLESAWMLHTRKGINARIVRLPLSGDVNELWLQSKKDFKDKITESLYYAKDYYSTFHFNKKSEEKQKKDRRKNRSKLTLPNLEAVRSISIVEVVGDLIGVEQANENRHTALCPFHEDETQSLSIYEDSNSFYCFGCSKKGDAVTFIRDLKDLSFGDTVKYLYERYVR